jgi:hypothetical protein
MIVFDNCSIAMLDCYKTTALFYIITFISKEGKSQDSAMKLNEESLKNRDADLSFFSHFVTVRQVLISF